MKARIFFIILLSLIFISGCQPSLPDNNSTTTTGETIGIQDSTGTDIGTDMSEVDKLDKDMEEIEELDLTDILL